MKRICIIGTGGTIAGTSAGAAGRYRAGSLGIAALLASVPGLEHLAQIQAESLANIGSQNMSEALWLRLAQRVRQLRDGGQCDGDLCDGSQCDGVVIVHGTDTMEETAFFLDLVLPPSVMPVVLTGAMRPATDPAADGPPNLLAAVAVAAAAQAAGRGVLVVMNGEIHRAAAVSKSHTLRLDSFVSESGVAAGSVRDGNICFYNGDSPACAAVAGNAFFSSSSSSASSASSSPSVVPGIVAAPGDSGLPFDLDRLLGLGALPKTGIVTAFAGESGEVIAALVSAGCRGIVYAGFGNGNFSDIALDALLAARRAGVVVVRSSRVPFGPVTATGEVDDAAHGFIAAGALNAFKARVLLSLALTRSERVEDVAALFARYGAA